MKKFIVLAMACLLVVGLCSISFAYNGIPDGHGGVQGGIYAKEHQTLSVGTIVEAVVEPYADVAWTMIPQLEFEGRANETVNGYGAFQLTCNTPVSLSFNCGQLKIQAPYGTGDSIATTYTWDQTANDPNYKHWINNWTDFVSGAWGPSALVPKTTNGGVTYFMGVKGILGKTIDAQSAGFYTTTLTVTVASPLVIPQDTF